MGLISAAMSAAGGTLADQWLEFFYCDSMSNDVLLTKGQVRTNGSRNQNTKGNDNIISNGSKIAVNEGQCMIIVDQGAVVDFCAEPGEFIYDTSSEPSLFYGKLGENLLNTFKTIGKRIAMGGNTGKDQRVYFINTKEILQNKWGTPQTVPFKIVDPDLGMKLTVNIKANGEYSFKIVDPLLFYKHVSGNVTGDYTKENLASIMKSELCSALQPAFAKISAQRIEYDQLIGHTTELCNILNEELSSQWGDLRGINIASISINSVKANEEDEKRLKDAQERAVYRDPNMGAAAMTLGTVNAMEAAAKNTSTGPMMAFAGMNMAGMMGGQQAAGMYQMGQAQQMYQQPMQQPMGQPMQAGAVAGAPVNGWTCACGATGNTGKFCGSCGAPKPSDAGWTCSCGTVNQGNFCNNCGAKRPAGAPGAPLYKCDKCGYEPEDPANPPKFCPQCGDPFNEADIKQ